MNVYVAYHKETGEKLSDARGRVIFESPEGLNRSLGSQFWYKEEARKKGFKKVRELYDIVEFELHGGRVL